MDYVIGVDLGGTFMRAVAADRTGRILDHVRQPTERMRGPDAVIDRMVECIEQVRASVPTDGTLLRVGVGSPGPLDPVSGVVFHAPNMPGWYNVPLRDRLAERVGLPVDLGNDANVAALGEWLFGGGRGHQHMVYITVSTGIGTGVICDGRLLLGRLGAAAEMGQVLIDNEHVTSWENLASGTAMAQTAAIAMQDTPRSLLHQLATSHTVTAAHVAQAAAQGDELAARLMEREARLLGVGMLNTLYAFSPDIMLVGGGVVLANPSLLERARQVIQQHAIADIYHSVPIEVTHLGEQVGVIGAAALAFYAHDRLSNDNDIDTRHT